MLCCVGIQQFTYHTQHFSRTIFPMFVHVTVERFNFGIHKKPGALAMFKFCIMFYRVLARIKGGFQLFIIRDKNLHRHKCCFVVMNYFYFYVYFVRKCSTYFNCGRYAKGATVYVPMWLKEIFLN